MGAGKQFLLLLWKNWLLQKRKVVFTIFEIGLPTVLALIFMLIRIEVSSQDVTEPTTWPAFEIKDEFPSRITVPNAWILAYTPDNAVTRKIMQDVQQQIDQVFLIQAFPNETAMENYILEDEEFFSRIIWGGITFTDQFGNPPALSKHTAYKIRPRAEKVASSYTDFRPRFFSASDWYTSTMMSFFDLIGPRNPLLETGGTPGYVPEGFATLQHSIDRAIIKEMNHSADVDNIELHLRRFPYPPYINDPFIMAIQQQLSFIILLSLILAAFSIVKDIVLEKERKLKESMKMMGLSNWLHWAAWFVKYVMFLLVSATIMTVLFCVDPGHGRVLTQSEPSLIFVFLLLYSISTICFCFMVSVFFSKANSGAAAGGVLFFLTYVPYFFFQTRYDDLNMGTKLGVSVLHNVAMAMGCQQIGLWEGAGNGVQWSNFHRQVTTQDPYTVAHTMGMFIVDSFIYLFITWYFDAVFPGEFGVPKPWYFPVTKSYWCGSSSSKHSDDEMEIDDLHQSDMFEANPGHLQAGIRIRGLRKVFKRGKTVNAAVDGIYLDMFEGQITALLGHNGAGKTTTMSMLTGFIPPTDGTAYINGYDVRYQLDSVRESLGLCPQHNVLFDTLTVDEHLIFFAKLKGCPSKQVSAEVDSMVQTLGLQDKRKVQSQHLSGGMKRKLSVGIALIAGSKTVILDEPTSGMDPEARRQTWDILKEQRKGRTILLTTHYMDEADLLGDRIAIMADGQLQCCGTSLFLKSKYGVGYHLVLVKEPWCHVHKVSEVIQRYVPQAQLESNISAELSFVLPQESSSCFEELFLELETSRKQLGISSFGASVTTLEEVFLKVGEGLDVTIKKKLERLDTAETALCEDNSALPDKEWINAYENPAYVTGEEIQARSNGAANGFTPGGRRTPEAWPEVYIQDPANTAPPFYHYTTSTEDLPPVFGTKIWRNTGSDLFLQQFRALLQKRILHTWRNRLVTITQLCVPLMCAIIACLIIKSVPGPRDPPALDLNLEPFDGTEQLVAYSTGYPNDTSPDLVQLGESYARVMEDRANEVVHTNALDEPMYDVQDYIVKIGEESIERYNRDYMVAASFERGANDTINATAHFNNQAYHTIVISLSMVGNALLDFFAGEDHSIHAENHPLPRSPRAVESEDLATNTIFNMALVNNMMFGTSFLIGTFVVFLIKERTVKAKHLQTVSGVHTGSFWLTTFIWDFTNFLIPTILVIIVFVAFEMDAFTRGSNIGYVFMLFMLYAWAGLPYVYLLSHLFTVPSTGYVTITALTIFTGSASLMSVQILKLPTLGTEDIGYGLEWFFYIILPNFGFASGLSNLFINYNNLNMCTELNTVINGTEVTIEDYCWLLEHRFNQTSNCCPGNCGWFCADYHDNYMAITYPGLGQAVLFLSMQGVVCFFILYLMEAGHLRTLQQIAISGTLATPEDHENASDGFGGHHEDEDVKKERQRVLASLYGEEGHGESQNALVLAELKKFYGPLLAVDRLTLAVPRGECFGLLGVNGAGKTTTFKMLTGDEISSQGDAYLEGFSIKDNIKEVQQRLGYCPQFDALIDQLTVREHLKFYARLRGVVEVQIPVVAEDLIRALLLEKHADKQAGDLSGGNKRKLSTAIALVGDPPVVFLDEPTTGMDPVARRLLWDTLSRVRQSGRTLILTSHSMEECEALCTRLAIMVNGQFKCLGGPQALKAKYGSGYTLVAKVKGTDDIELETRTHNLMTFIEETFPDSKLKDSHQALVDYQVSSEKLTWASVFGTIERAKEEYFIEDYSVSQTTLEQVFIGFARAQRPPRELGVGCTVKCRNFCCFFCCCKCCRSESEPRVQVTRF